MKVKFNLLIIMAFLIFIGCGGGSEPKEYVHTRAGFKITAPAGWDKTNEDIEMYEFRSGDLKLVEVGGFDLPADTEDILSLSDEEFMVLLKQSTMDGLDGYCSEAKINGYQINEENEAEWGGEVAYRVQASGYSSEALATMIVDMIASVRKEKGRMYMFASQIEQSIYPKVKKDLELMIASFQILE